MTNKSLFRAVAKQVHPDMSTNNVSGDRMREVLKFKDNPDMLIRLSRKWGLNIDGTFDEKAFNERSKSFNQRVFDAVVGAIIQHLIINKRIRTVVRGVIINKRVVTRGHFKNAVDFKVYDFKTGRILRLKSYNRQPFDFIIGMASSEELNDGIEKDKSIKEFKKAKTAIRQDIANSNFKNVGIIPNCCNYRDENVKVLVNYKGGPKWEKLVRTTAKCVFIESGRRINIKSILESRKSMDINI